MQYQRIQVSKLTETIGAEITGVDLSQPLDEAARKEIDNAFTEHLVIFFRDQDIRVEDHKRFAEAFGEIYTHPVYQPKKAEGQPEVFELASSAERPFLAAAWHTDITFEPEPPMASILRAVEVPEAGGDTLFASMIAAYEGLSDRMQRLLSGLEAIHDPGFFRKLADDEQRRLFEERGPTIHPVIRTHPVTGRKAIFVNSVFTTQIVGMKERESRALLSFLYEHVTTPEYQCRFHWTRNAVGMWDNRCTQHRAVADHPRARRVMQRLTLAGERPV